MKIKMSTIQALGKIITGDGDISPYRSGPKLVNFFNQYGGDAVYGAGFPSRWKYTEDELIRINDLGLISKVIEESVNPVNYIDTEFNVDEVVDYLNKYLMYDGLRLMKTGMCYELVKKGKSSQIISSLIDLDYTEQNQTDKLRHGFILEQIDKCKDKVSRSDYDGAITNARSLVESVFEELISRSGKEVDSHDGNLNSLYKQVKKCLNLDADQLDLSETLKQLLRGLVSVVSGVAGISNKMSDRHARKYKPQKHHAILAINCANTICGFLVDSFDYQKQKVEVDFLEKA